MCVCVDLFTVKIQVQLSSWIELNVAIVRVSFFADLNPTREKRFQTRNGGEKIPAEGAATKYKLKLKLRN